MHTLILWSIILFQAFTILCLWYWYAQATKPTLPDERDIDAMMMHQFANKYMREHRNAQKVNDALSSLGNRSGFVYVIKETGLEKFYKIGMTSTIENRLAALETAMPYPMEIVGIYPCNRFADLEATLHRLYRKQRRKHEWFELSAADLESINQLCVAWKD